MMPFFYRAAVYVILLLSCNAAYATAESMLVKDKQPLNSTDKLLMLTPPSVLDKKLIPPSGDKHDFMSVGKYLWPNPATPNGLPYVYKDGMARPGWETYGDYQSLDTMARAVIKLAKLYQNTHKETYAKKAIELLRVWFLDPRTRMNPNMRYANAIPGSHEGTSSGVMHSLIFGAMVDVIPALEASPAWTTDEQQQLRSWFTQFLTWLTQDKQGSKESDSTNNHGSWYDVQVVSIALYIGDTTLAKSILERSKEKRIARMIEPDGSQPLELNRTLSMGYTLFSLSSFCRLATMGESVGVDLWNYETKDGRSIHKALDYILPYFEENKPWPYPQINPLTPSDLKSAASMISQAATIYHNPRYQKVADKIQSQADAASGTKH